MPLDSYQLYILKDIRKEERQLGLKFISLTTGSGYSALDAYRKQTYTEIYTLFSGALLFDPFSRKQDSAGGFYKTSEMIIVASRDHKTLAAAKDTKVQYDNIKFRIDKVIDCEDTEEIVIYATRLE